MMYLTRKFQNLRLMGIIDIRVGLIGYKAFNECLNSLKEEIRDTLDENNDEMVIFKELDRHVMVSIVLTKIDIDKDISDCSVAMDDFIDNFVCEIADEVIRHL